MDQITDAPDAPAAFHRLFGYARCRSARDEFARDGFGMTEAAKHNGRMRMFPARRTAL